MIGRVARALGILCGPPLVVLALGSIVTVFGGQEIRAIDMTAFVVALAILPVLVVYGAYRAGYVSDLGLPEREPRVVVATISLLSALTGVVALMALGAASTLIAVAAGICLQLFVVDLITLRSKVSYHSAGVSSLAITGWYLGGMSLALPLGAIAIATGWSRWYLGKHTGRQVIAGFATSLALVIWFVDLGGRFGLIR
ncbi:MAG: hypothetical protein EPO26_00070 [Chloroflexota bacterium]|nr:MAG: hypothetical protein EPO26_00070 [Chloroflexota bacterium]